MGILTVFVVLLWYLSSLVGGWFGIFSTPGEPPVFLGLFLVVPTLFFGGLYATSRNFRAFAQNISLSWIVGAHLWRYVGLFFLLSFVGGTLPAGFALPAGLGDVMIAGFALPLALAVHRRKPVRRSFVTWNILGLVDLVLAVSLGVLYSGGPAGMLRSGISTGLMTAFPVNLIPTFFVPLFILLHLLALRRRGEVGAALGNQIISAAGPRQSLPNAVRAAKRY